MCRKTGEEVLSAADVKSTRLETEDVDSGSVWDQVRIELMSGFDQVHPEGVGEEWGEDKPFDRLRAFSSGRRI